VKTRTRNTLAMGCAAALLLASGLASASTISECRGLIGANDNTGLYLKTQAADFAGKSAARDEAGLLAKLGDADTKLDYAKFADASQKMYDYHDQVLKLGQFNAKGAYKLNPEDAGELAEDAQAIIACILDIGL